MEFRLRKASPVRLQITGFHGKIDSRVVCQGIVEAPRFLKRQCLGAKYLRIACKSEKSLLSQPAKVTSAVGCQSIEPDFGCCMMNMRGKRHSQPDVNVRKQHLRRPGFRRSAGWSVAGCQDANSERAAIELVQTFGRLFVQQGAKCKRSRPRATARPARVLRRHYELDRRLSCSHYQPQRMAFQAASCH